MKKKKTLIASLKKVLKAFGGEDTKSNNAVDLISEIADNISTSGSADYITKDNPMLTEYYNYDWVKIGEGNKAVYFVNDNIFTNGWETNMAQLDGSNTYAYQLATNTRQASYGTTIAQLKKLPKYIGKLWDLGYMIPHDSSADGQLYILVNNYLFLIQYSGISGVSITITLRRLNEGACLRTIQYGFQADTITSGTTDYLKVYTGTVTPNKYVKTNADGFPALVDDTKLESNQGVENAGKYLGISATGEVEPQEIEQPDLSNYVSLDNPMMNNDFFTKNWKVVYESTDPTVSKVYMCGDNLPDGWETNFNQIFSGSITYGNKLADYCEKVCMGTNKTNFTLFAKYMKMLYELGYIPATLGYSKSGIQLMWNQTIYNIVYSGIMDQEMVYNVHRRDYGDKDRNHILKYNYTTEWFDYSTSDYLQIVQKTTQANQFIKTNADGIAKFVEDTKLENNQGSANAGKFLGIASDGTVEPQTINSSPLLVHITLNDTTSEYEADYTFAQIRSAIDQRPVYAILDNVYMPFAGIVYGEKNDINILFRVYRLSSASGYYDYSNQMLLWQQIAINELSDIEFIEL